MLDNKSLLFGDIYLWFANVLYVPDENMFSKEYFMLLKDICDSLEADVNEEVTIFNNMMCSKEVDLKSIKIEHSKLFIGPFSLKAPPYESYYTDNNNVKNYPVLQMISFINQAGLKISDGFIDTPDHIVMELNFMSELCYTEHLTLQHKDNNMLINARQNIIYFLTHHLLKWVTDFRKAVERGASIDLYPVVVKMLEKVLVKHYHCLCAS